MSTFSVPAVLAQGRWRSGDELNAIASGWLGAVGAVGAGGGAVAVALPTTPEGVALLVGLSSLPSPLVLLPPDVRAWRTEPAIPPGSPLVLLSTLAHLAPDAEKLGLVPLVLPEASTRGGPPIEPFRGAGVVLFTSGSSGLPKPVFHRMDSEVAWVGNRIRSMGLAPGAGLVVGAPLAYAQGFTHLLTAILLGGPLGLLDPRDYRLALRTLAEPVFRCWRCTPHLVEAVARCALTGPPVVPPVCIVSTPVAKGTFDAFVDRFGVPLRQTYSTTETGTITLDDSPVGHVQPDTVGRPLRQVDVRIGDSPFEPAAPGDLGRVWVRSPGLMQGYGFPPDLEPRADVDGWWPTQDLGRLRSDGYLVLGGRRDDAIRTRDNRTVNLAYVAERLREIDRVADAAVVAVDTPSGQSFGAVVEHEPGLTLGDIQGWLADTLPPWSRPRVLALVLALPRLPNGKPDRQACVRLLAEAASA